MWTFAQILNIVFLSVDIYAQYMDMGKEATIFLSYKEPWLHLWQKLQVFSMEKNRIKKKNLKQLWS